MPNVKNSVFKALSRAIIHRDKTGTFFSTTLAAAAAAGAGTISTVGNTNGAIGDTIRIGPEVNRITNIAGAGPYTITLAFPLTFAYAIGETVREMTSFDFGDIEAAGASVRVQGESTDVLVSTQRLVYSILNGYQDFGVEFAFPNLSLHSFPIMLGMLGSVVSGSGTVALPTHFATDGNQFAGEANVAATFEGVLMDGTVAYVEMWGCDVDYSGASLQMALGQLASLPVKMFGFAGVTGQGSPGYTVDATLKPTKAKVLQSLTEVGFFTPLGASPLNSTVATATAAAGQKTLELAAVTNGATGDLVKINTQNLAEYHEISSVSAPNIVLRTNLLRDQPVGTPVVEYTRVPFAGVGEDGCTLDIGGETTPIRTATSRTSLGRRPGPAAITFKFTSIEMTPSQIAYALGIAQSLIVSTRLPITGAVIGAASLDGLYFKGLCEDGSVFELRFWGCVQSITDFLMTWTNQGQVPSLPIEVRPTSGMQVLNYA